MKSRPPIIAMAAPPEPVQAVAEPCCESDFYNYAGVK
jgi:hypothetical protein